MDSSDVPIIKAEIDRNQVELAVKALFAFIKKSSESKKKLFDENEVFSLTMSLKKIPKSSIRPYLIPLSHPINDSAEVCYISALPGKETRTIFEQKGITKVTKVLSMEKLRKNYKSFKMKRELCAAYDIFLCDSKLFSMMPKCLGKEIYTRKKQPLPILFKRDIKQQIDRALGSTRLAVGIGPCSNIKVGLSDQTVEEIVENIINVADYIAENLPGGWPNVKSLHLKTGTSISLPIHNSLPEYEGNSKNEKEESKKSTKKITRKKLPRKRPLLDTPTGATEAANGTDSQGKSSKDSNENIEMKDGPKSKKLIKLKRKDQHKKKSSKATKPLLKKIGVR